MVAPAGAGGCTGGGWAAHHPPSAPRVHPPTRPMRPMRPPAHAPDAPTHPVAPYLGAHQYEILSAKMFSGLVPTRRSHDGPTLKSPALTALARDWVHTR